MPRRSFLNYLLVIMLLGGLITACSNAARLSQMSNEELGKLDEIVIMKNISIYHGFNRCGSDSVQRLKKEIIRRYPDWDDKAQQAILNCDVYIGMTSKQVATAWGLPEIEPTQDKNVWTSYEKWSYNSGRKIVNLSFENNKLSNILYINR